jgi:hypothetical protein
MNISDDIVDRELAYALVTSEMLYKLNLRTTFKENVYRIIVLIIRFFRLENIVKKLLKWKNR